MTDHDEEFEPWTLHDLTGHLRRQDVDADGRVVREVTRRIAEQLPDVKALDPLHLALDLSHALTSVAQIADHLIRHWMSDLETDEQPRDLETLVERLKACAADFREISGTF